MKPIAAPGLFSSASAPPGRRQGRQALRPCTWLLLAVLGCLQTACSKPEGESATAPAQRAVPVAVAISEQRDVEVIEQSLGRLEAPRIPAVAAETIGQIREVRVDAGDRVTPGAILAVLDDEAQRLALESAKATVARLDVLLENQQRTVNRYEQLSAEQSVARSLLDDAVAQARALRAQVAEASARAREAQRALAKTTVKSPIDGIVQAKHASVGDFVTPGQPLFEIVAIDTMRAYLPFPETLSGRIAPGQAVTLTLPTRTGTPVAATVTEIRPMVGTGSNAIEAIVAFTNPGDWMPGASVRGRIVIEHRDGSVVVPEGSVVQRPSGEIVYEIRDGVAHARPVSVGIRQKGWVEISEGLPAGVPIATDGAGFLTDGTPVRTP